eukprot:COSAG06_NODE_379_length_16608_cov_83.792477_4_plen_80_part_00
MKMAQSTVSKNALFEPFVYKKRAFYQDRLGTNIGKLKKTTVFPQAFSHTHTSATVIAAAPPVAPNAALVGYAYARQPMC